MEKIGYIEQYLRIPEKCLREESDDRFVCLVNENWLKAIANQRPPPVPGPAVQVLAQTEASVLLARANDKVPQPWHRVSIKMLFKSDEAVHSLVEQPLGGDWTGLTYTEIMAAIHRQNFCKLWEHTNHNYPKANIPHGPGKGQCLHKSQTAILRGLLREHFSPEIIPLGGVIAHMDPGTHSPTSGHWNLMHAYAVLESPEAFYVVQPYWPYSLGDCVTFSPSKLSGSYAKPLFVLYQILQALRHSHKAGVALGEMGLHDVLMDEKLWLRMSYPALGQLWLPIADSGLHAAPRPSTTADRDPTNAETDYTAAERDSTAVDAAAVPEQCQNRPDADRRCTLIPADSDATVVQPLPSSHYTLSDLASLMARWVAREISNLDYLMALNHLAQRRMGDPNHHPVLPWVSDFSSPSGKFRDLSKSKFRLNKGDTQLELTYDAANLEVENAGSLDNLQIPHHITDFLSDITYYVYMARRIPKSILCANVRSKWVPHEYPSSMARMQEWTPDECIPEFFTDPSIFTSIHEDLPDLEVPSWASSPEDFVRHHRELLESDHVSQRLHHWVDLTFGYKLSGTAAVKAKNVCLQLVDQHRDLTNHGVVQLFNQPHPPRQVPSVVATRAPPHFIRPPSQMHNQDQSNEREGKERRESNSLDRKSQREIVIDDSTILLPKGYDPLALLDQVESLVNFSSKAAHTLLPGCQMQPPCLPDYSSQLVDKDMQAFGYLVVELFLSPRLRVLNPESSVQERYRTIRRVCQKNMEEIPRPLRAVIKELLQLDRPWQPNLSASALSPLFTYPVVNAQGLPAPDANLLLSISGSLPFPSYFPALYALLCRHMDLQRQLDLLQFRDMSGIERREHLRQLNKEQVLLMARFVHRHLSLLDAPGLDLLLPYALSLMSHPWTAVQAVWAMFNPLATALGPARSATVFLHPVTSLMDGEWSSPKHVKLYHRSFIIQLLIRLGVKCFLSSFATLLVEAAAGYKDFRNEEAQTLVDADNELPGEAEQPDLDYPEVFEMDEREMSGELLDIPAIAEQSYQSSLPEEDSEELPSDRGDKGSSDSGSLGRNSEEQMDDHSANSLDVGNSCENGSTGSGPEASEEILGQSVGRHSLHSLTRFMPEETEGSGSEDDPPARERHASSGSQVNNEPADVGTEPGEAMASERYPSTALDPAAEYNIRHAAAETIKWLSHRLGPVLTAKYLSRNLLRMLALCYLGDEQLLGWDKEEGWLASEHLSTTNKRIVGDGNASQVLECLSCVAILYGEHVILLQFFPHMKELIINANKRLNARSEAGVFAAIALLIHILPFISDATLMDNLKEVIFKDFLLPLLHLVSSLRVSFPGSIVARRALCYKIIDTLYLISLRIGFEMTRQHMTYILQKFFASFNRVYDENFLKENPQEVKTEETKEDKSAASSPGASSLYFELKLDNETKEFKISTQPHAVEGTRHQRQGSGTYKYTLSQPSQEDKADMEEESSATGNQEKIFHELLETFTPEMAHTAYIPFCKLAGGIHMEQNLINDDLIRQLCSIHDEALSRQKPAANDSNPHAMAVSEKMSDVCDDEDPDVVSGSFGRAVSFAGNRIVLHSDPSSGSHTDGSIRPRSADQAVDYNKLRSPEMEINQHRHLKGNWLAYWEHEIGLSERDSSFNFKQIKLLTFTGHTSSVRSMYVLGNENSFLSASKDKTVRLWSLRSTGDGAGRVNSQWTYTHHKKSVFAVTFLEAPRMAASCDGSVHIWDPFGGLGIRQYESPKNNPVTVLGALPAPQSVLLTATAESTLRFLDVRAARYTHEFKCSTGPSGMIRSLCVSPDGHWVAVGYQSGVMSLLDVRTGVLFASWKCHEGEILQVKPYGMKAVVTCSLDQTMAAWSVEDAKLLTQLKGPTDPVHCFHLYGQEVISASTGNRIGVHTSVERQAGFSSTKLRSDVFRGMLTTMAVLPENKLLLLGADNGNIKLLA